MRWVSPAGTNPGSSPSAPHTYGRTTRTSDPSAIKLNSRARREPVRRYSSRPPSGTLRKATNAA